MLKKAFVTKEQIEEIVKEYPTPFHIYDEKGIRENAKKLKKHLHGILDLRSILRLKRLQTHILLIF